MALITQVPSLEVHTKASRRIELMLSYINAK